MRVLSLGVFVFFLRDNEWSSVFLVMLLMFLWVVIFWWFGGEFCIGFGGIIFLNGFCYLVVIVEKGILWYLRVEFVDVVWDRGWWLFFKVMFCCWVKFGDIFGCIIGMSGGGLFKGILFFFVLFKFSIMFLVWLFDLLVILSVEKVEIWCFRVFELGIFLMELGFIFVIGENDFNWLGVYFWLLKFFLCLNVLCFFGRKIFVFVFGLIKYLFFFLLY